MTERGPVATADIDLRVSPLLWEQIAPDAEGLQHRLAAQVARLCRGLGGSVEPAITLQPGAQPPLANPVGIRVADHPLTYPRQCCAPLAVCASRSVPQAHRSTRQRDRNPTWDPRSEDKVDVATAYARSSQSNAAPGSPRPAWLYTL